MGWPKKVLRTFKFKVLNEQHEFLKEAKKEGRKENQWKIGGSYLFVRLFCCIKNYANFLYSSFDCTSTCVRDDVQDNDENVKSTEALLLISTITISVNRIS